MAATTPARRATARATLEFAPLTPKRWPDLAQLFGPNGACGGCWCQWFKRSTDEFKRMKGGANRRAFKREVDAGARPGLIAYDAGQPVGWCAVQPREAYPMLARSRTLAAVDDRSVWSITCLFVKAGHRRKGISLALIEAAKDFVAARGGRLLEAYPKDPRSGFNGANSMWTGVASTFRAAGFHEVARRSPIRPIMRFELRRAPGGR
jgi:GNAT superfamily N-acetyltransferase